MTALTTSGKYTPEQRRLLGQAYRMILGWGSDNIKRGDKATDKEPTSKDKPKARPTQQRVSHE